MLLFVILSQQTRSLLTFKCALFNESVIQSVKPRETNDAESFQANAASSNSSPVNFTGEQMTPYPTFAMEYPDGHQQPIDYGQFDTEFPVPDSGIQSAESSENQQSNAEIAQSMGLLPVDMSFAFAQSCILCAYGIPHPTVDDMTKLQDGTWYNGMKPEHFNTILSFLQPWPSGLTGFQPNSNHQFWQKYRCSGSPFTDIRELGKP